MVAIDASWDFLKDFYQSDPSSIVRLVNEAIRYHSSKSLRKDNFENFMEDLLSLLPMKTKSISYLDFLDYVMPYEHDAELSAREYDGEAQDILSHENAFLNHSWLEEFFNKTDFWGLAVFAVSVKIGKSIGRQPRYSWRDVWKRLRISYNFAKKVYKPKSIDSNPLYRPYLILEALGLTEVWYLYGRNSKDFLADDNVSLYYRYHRIKFLKKWKERIPKGVKEARLEPSPEQLYPVVTLLIVLRREWKFSKDGSYLVSKKDSLDIPAEKMNEALIYGLYRKFEDADPALIQKFDSEIPQVQFHPLIASHLINTGAYENLFKHECLENSINTLKIEKYQAAEKRLDDKKFNGKRLLVDYLFPYTQVRENDVFLPPDEFTNPSDFINKLIYLSLVKGKHYQQYWRRPKDGEKFELVQIDPINYNDESPLIAYFQYLAPEGDFLIVKSHNEYELEDSIKTAFSDFRHDLKPITYNLCNEIKLLLHYCNAGDILNQKEHERMGRIKDYFERLNSYINMAGNPKVERKLNKIQIVDFLRDFLRYQAFARNSGSITHEIDDSAIQQDYTIWFNEAILRIILDAIVENAYQHGFADNADCPNPTIAFVLVDTESYLLLKICNNGRPISIGINEFRTRGAMAGPTGHTGLGGYLINKYVTQLGGKVELPSATDKTWNTEIHLYFKK